MIYEDNIIDVVREVNLNNLHTSIEDSLIDKFLKELITNEDRMLLNLSFSKNPSQEDLNEFLKKWDIEVMGGGKALMLSYFMKMHPNLEFLDYVKPRLIGLLNFFRFKNLKTIAHFKKIGKALNKEKIPVMILKGGLMKFLRPEFSRVMGDIDIIVPWKNYVETGEIAKSLGYEFYEPNLLKSHSIDLHTIGSEEGTIDVHRFIYMGSGCEVKLNKGLFARAQEKNVFGIKTLVPSYEDAVFLSLVNLAKNLRENTSSAGILYTLFDCKFLIDSKPNFDWNIVVENSKKTKTQIEMGFAIKFINKIVPDLLPDRLQKEGLFAKEMKNYCKIVMFERFYYPEFQAKARSIKILDSIKSKKDFAEYLRVKPKYYLLKHIKEHPFWLNLFFKFSV